MWCLCPRVSLFSVAVKIKPKQKRWARLWIVRWSFVLYWETCRLKGFSFSEGYLLNETQKCSQGKERPFLTIHPPGPICVPASAPSPCIFLSWCLSPEFETEVPSPPHPQIWRFDKQRWMQRTRNINWPGRELTQSWLFRHFVGNWYQKYSCHVTFLINK